MAGEVPPSKSFTIGGVSVPRKVLYGLAVVALYIGGAAFALGYSNAGKQSTPSTPPEATSTCWDGSGVTPGERCSTAYDARALYWAFGIDPSDADCERSKSYDWSSVGLTCQYQGKDLRMAVWNSAKWRDRRLLEYGKPTAIGKGLVLHAPGGAERYLLRYDSQKVLLYASVKSDEEGLLDRLRPQVRSLKELQYGVKVPKG